MAWVAGVGGTARVGEGVLGVREQRAAGAAAQVPEELSDRAMSRAESTRKTLEHPENSECTGRRLAANA